MNKPNSTTTSLEQLLETDPRTNYAAIAYNHAFVLANHNQEKEGRIYLHGTFVARCINKLAELAGEPSIENEAFLSALNHMAKTAEICQLVSSTALHSPSPSSNSKTLKLKSNLSSTLTASDTCF